MPKFNLILYFVFMINYYYLIIIYKIFNNNNISQKNEVEVKGTYIEVGSWWWI